jgi:hypothetical protein
LATLVDDERGDALATTGAALSAGEELRPTGTDRGELRRISGLTGGKMRETLAGVFRDREARRFGYAPMSAWLAGLAAGALLLSVASRRLAGFGPLHKAKRKTLPEIAAAAEREPAIANSAGTLGALRARKERREEGRPDAAEAGATPAPVLIRAASGGRQTSDDLVPIQNATAESTQTERKKSAAEVLLERRRARTRR